jgi:hypothetical protein
MRVRPKNPGIITARLQQRNQFVAGITIPMRKIARISFTGRVGGIAKNVSHKWETIK